MDSKTLTTIKWGVFKYLVILAANMILEFYVFPESDPLWQSAIKGISVLLLVELFWYFMGFKVSMFETWFSKKTDFNKISLLEQFQEMERADNEKRKNHEKPKRKNSEKPKRGETVGGVLADGTE